MSDETEVVGSAVVFSGKAFSEARQKLGLSTEQVAHQLHLHERVINAIERGELDQLNDPVFTRGYIRSYARFLKLDADAQVTAYNQQTGNNDTTAQVRAIGSVSTVPGRGHGHPLLKVGSWLFVLALVAVIAWWWQAQFGFDLNERPPQDDLPVSVETTDGSTLVLPQINEMAPEAEAVVPQQEGALIEPVNKPESAASSTVDSVPAEGPREEVNHEATGPAADVVEAVANEAVAQHNEAQETLEAQMVAGFSGLVMDFADDCWLSVKDASGRTLYSGVAKGGTSLELDGKEPLAVVIGRVSAVAKIHYDNKPIELAPISKENVARLSLPL